MPPQIGRQGVGDRFAEDASKRGKTLSTGNAGHTLSDGALIILTGVVMADRTGQAYGEAVPPDETVDDVRQFALLMDEAIPQPAVDWLLAQPACAMP